MKKEQLQEIYVIADTHFSHQNILKPEYEDRPFDSIGDMNKTIIDNCNKIANKHSKIYFLGDLVFDNVVSIKEIMKQIQGYKYLVMGNHDDRSLNRWVELGLDWVYNYPILIDNHYLLSHEPIIDCGGFLNIHGHLHSKSLGDNNHICVSVEQTDYKPTKLIDIKRR